MTRPVESYVAHYWGKAQPANDDGPDWHPLAYHGLDVAAAGAVLLEARPQLLFALTRVSGLAKEVAHQWLLFALALHDIGKFADCFQCKAPEFWFNKAACSTPPTFDPGHGRLGLSLWESGCEIGTAAIRGFEALFGAPLMDRADIHACFSVWFAAVCGHHGRPVERHDLAGRACQDACADAAAYVRGCAKLFDLRLTGSRQRRADARMKSSIVAGCGCLHASRLDRLEPRVVRYLTPCHSLEDYWPVALPESREPLWRARSVSACERSGLFWLPLLHVGSLRSSFPAIR
jgi:CRISPR-associated endonuclease/helicase Cas3